MPDLDLKPDEYRRAGRPKIIPRRDAYFLLAYAIAGTLFLQWLVTSGTPGQWWNGFLMWPLLVLIGILVTRLWPMVALAEDEPNSTDRPER